jgi:hypothetical protein
MIFNIFQVYLYFKLNGENNKMLIHNKVYNLRKKEKRKLEREKLAKKVKPKKHLFLTS